MLALLFHTQEERCCMEVYNEYLRKLPQLPGQLETVETRSKCCKDSSDESVTLYAERLQRTNVQCLAHMADIRQQSRLFFALKGQLEVESPALQALMRDQ